MIKQIMPAGKWMVTWGGGYTEPLVGWALCDDGGVYPLVENGGKGSAQIMEDPEAKVWHSDTALWNTK